MKMMKRWDKVLETILDTIDADAQLEAIIGDAIKPDEDNDDIVFPSITYTTSFVPHYNENEHQFLITWNIWAHSKEEASDIEALLSDLFYNSRGYKMYSNGLYMFSELESSRDMPYPEPNRARRVAEFMFLVAKY